MIDYQYVRKNEYCWGSYKVHSKKNKIAVLKIEIDRELYEKYKKVVKSKNQMLKGYNDNLFLKAVKDELKKENAI